MTTAHRPTFDPVPPSPDVYRIRELTEAGSWERSPKRSGLPSETAPGAYAVKNTPGQGGDADPQVRDLRAQLLEAEAAHYSKKGGSAPSTSKAQSIDIQAAPKRQLEAAAGQEAAQDESPDAKRRRILEETRDIDADLDGSESESSEGERLALSSKSSCERRLTPDSDDEDETAELLRELEKIKKERAEQREREEAEKAAEEQEKREHDIALGNPLLNPTKDFSVRRRWDDDVVFKNQARGTEDKRKKEFVNDLLRSDFHKRFMSKYVR
ncbi:hypothetical protein MMC30_009049 [Trapelia coarctata]|nr:hypothetical protein [Trapelia coarctata]